MCGHIGPKLAPPAMASRVNLNNSTLMSHSQTDTKGLVSRKYKSEPAGQEHKAPVHHSSLKTWSTNSQHRRKSKTVPKHADPGRAVRDSLQAAAMRNSNSLTRPSTAANHHAASTGLAGMSTIQDIEPKGICNYVQSVKVAIKCVISRPNSRRKPRDINAAGGASHLHSAITLADTGRDLPASAVLAAEAADDAMQKITSKQESLVQLMSTTGASRPALAAVATAGMALATIHTIERTTSSSSSDGGMFDHFWGRRLKKRGRKDSKRKPQIAADRIALDRPEIPSDMIVDPSMLQLKDELMKWGMQCPALMQLVFQPDIAVPEQYQLIQLQQAEQRAKEKRKQKLAQQSGPSSSNSNNNRDGPASSKVTSVASNITEMSTGEQALTDGWCELQQITGRLEIYTSKYLPVGSDVLFTKAYTGLEHYWQHGTLPEAAAAAAQRKNKSQQQSKHA